MTSARTLVRFALGLGMGAAGAAHFVTPQPFVGHIPETVPYRAELVAVTGGVELLLAFGVIGPRRWRRASGIALAAYLVVVLPANIYAAVSQVPIDGVPAGWARWGRLPLQVPLILAALWSTRDR